MMAAMMLPATAPMIVVFASAQARHERPTAVPTWIFVAGYLLVWVAAGAVVYVVVQVGTKAATLITLDGPGQLGAAIALGFTLVAAGLYQFTPLKRVCLSHCRSPLAFVAQYWRDGRLGALQMGISTRDLLSWVLLGTFCGARRRRPHEPGLDASADAGCLCRKGPSPRTTHFNCHRCRICRPRDHGSDWSGRQSVAGKSETSV